MSAPKLVLVIVVGIVLAFAVIRGLRTAETGSDPNSAPTSYEVVPCDQHPEAIGC